MRLGGPVSLSLLLVALLTMVMAPVDKNAKTFDTNTYGCVASNAGGDTTKSVSVSVNRVDNECE